MTGGPLTVLPVPLNAEVTPQTDLPALLAGALPHLLPGDVLVVTSKVVSKWLGRYADQALPREDLVLQQSHAVVAERRTPTGVTRVVHAHAGPVMAGAGIDASNAQDDRLLLLPDDPDAAAARLRAQLAGLLGRPVDFAVLLSDTSGRPWRAALTDFALGAAGLTPVDDLRGLPDTAGRDLAVTVRGIADEIAAAADLVKGKVDRVPAAVVRGLARFVTPADGPGAAALVRTGPTDWFALGRAEAVRDSLGIPAGSAAAQAVGIAAASGDEPATDRVRRALAVAAHGEAAPEVQTRVAAAAAAVTVELSCADPVQLGRRWARLEVALAGELLRSHGERTGPSSVRVTVPD